MLLIKSLILEEQIPVAFAGAVLYIKREFNLQSQPTMEGLLLAMSLIGATVITTFSGSVSDGVGRRPMLILSSVLYFLGVW
jgi:MFS family permease